MNNSIMPYEYEGKQVRTINENGELYWIAKDVCDVLGFENSRQAVTNHVHKDDVSKRYTLTNGGEQEMNLVNEAGLYSLIFGSKLPNAQKFKRWVMKEVLPSIRKTGGYSTDAGIMLKETSLGKIKELYVQKCEDNFELEKKIAGLELKLILKTSKRHKITDLQRMVELKTQVMNYRIPMTEEELAKAFGLSVEKLSNMVRLYLYSNSDYKETEVYKYQANKALEADYD